MNENENEGLAPEDTGGGEKLYHAKGRKAFRNVRRELSDDELSSPAVQRLLIDEIERLEKENGELKIFRDDYHQADKNLGIMAEKSKIVIAQDVIFGVCLSVGSGLIGLVPSVWETGKYVGPMMLVFGGVLIIGGIGTKLLRK
jgi:hypothetical protein